jgi:hypothetical protein
MTFTVPLLLIFLLATTLEIAGVFLVKRIDMQYLLLFCAIRNIACFLVRDSQKGYWLTAWTGHQVMLCWMAWIAGSICQPKLNRYVARVPFFVVVLLSLMNPSWLTLPADMHQYAWHASAVIVGTCLIALLFLVAQDSRQMVAGFCALAGASLAASLWSLQSGSHPVPETGLWCACLLWLLVAAKGNPQFGGIQQVGSLAP